ncbi:MAG: pilus assembly protein [Dokdonella sp.]|nr:pilus assembly protein [Dokdonella sp.]
MTVIRNPHRHRHASGQRARQRGAVLYVALIMLILLALIGIVGMQVAGIQERMAASYRAINRAFQNTEALVRATECGLEVMNNIARPGCTAVSASNVNRECDDGYDAGTWARWVDPDTQLVPRTLAHAPAVNVRQIEGCIIGEAEIAMGQTQETGAGLMPIYQITTYQTDTADIGGANPSSAVVLDTIFKL